MKNKILLLPFIVWLLLSIAEIIGSHYISPKIVYWRAWEKVSNYDGVDNSTVPFKPNIIYSGKSVGDLLNSLYLKPRKEEIRNQYFAVDEFGFRNAKGLLKKPIKAVITGSSYVAGAQSTQENLVSEMLTNKFDIPTYNYAIIPMQRFWEDKRFTKNPPEYFILLGAEGEFISAHWKSEIVDKNEFKDIPSWEDTNKWQLSNVKLKYDYQSLQGRLLNFSLIRILTNNINIEFINFGKNRQQIANSFPNSPVKYDPMSDNLYYNPSYDNPIYGNAENTSTNIREEIKTLINSREILKKRGITLIVAAMPSKTNLQHPRYTKTPREKIALVKLEEELEKNRIEHVKLYDATKGYVKDTGKYLYYKDDSHWNTEANKIIAELIYKKINEIEKKNNIMF